MLIKLLNQLNNLTSINEENYYIITSKLTDTLILETRKMSTAIGIYPKFYSLIRVLIFNVFTNK